MKKTKQKKKRTLKAFLVAFIALLILPGCTTTMKGGSGQLFRLSEHHVVYRDLTVPVSLGNEPEARTSQDYPSVAP